MQKFDRNASARQRIAKHRKIAGIVIWIKYRKRASILCE
jgi:hypothetical protein